LVDFIKSSPRIDGCDEILLPGEPERRMLAQRTRDGIFLDEGNWSQLTNLATKIQVTAPALTA
jgi:uncharacterized oxidoreductase